MTKLHALSAAILLALASPAAAQSNCGPRDKVIAALAVQYGESVVSRGIVGNDKGETVAAMEVFVNPATGSFTVLLTRPDGVACFAASGGNFETVKGAVGDPA